MRDELRKLGDEERHEFTATFERTGWKDGFEDRAAVGCGNGRLESGRSFVDEFNEGI